MSKVLKIKQPCSKCKKEIFVYRKDIRYWPDHLWVPNVQAHYFCRKCGHKTWTWKHELPSDWQEDCPYQDWGAYHLPTLLDSCQFHGIKSRLEMKSTEECKNETSLELTSLERFKRFIKNLLND